MYQNSKGQFMVINTIVRSLVHFWVLFVNQLTFDVFNADILSQLIGLDMGVVSNTQNHCCKFS